MSYPEFPFQTLPQNLTVQEMRNPYLVIAAFFDMYHLPHASRLLDKWMRSAFAEKSRFSKTAALSTLNLVEQLIRLLEAGQLLNDDPTNEEKALERFAAHEMTNTSSYYRPHKKLTAWDCFPRYLSTAEFANPYRVFEKCLGHFDLAGWRKVLKDLFFAATCNSLVTEVVSDDDIYTTQKYLFKLLYACHLIKVREIDPGISSVPETTNPKNPLHPAAHVYAE